MNWRSNGRFLLAAWILITAVSAVLLPSAAGRQLPAFLLLWVAPAIGWTFWGLGTFEEESLLERFFIGAGLGLLLNGLLALVIGYVPGAPPRWGLLAGAIVVALGPLVMGRAGARRGRGKAVSWLLVGVLAAALGLRLANAGYKELQGDEGVIMVRAAAVLTGDEEEIFLHQKGPVEILLPLTTWGLTGETNDFWARLPFAWAGLLGVGVMYVLGRRWGGDRVGIAAALLFAICGFGIAFSRIIQYQTLVMLWGGLALLAGLRYRQKGRALDLALAAVFLGGGLLAHYDAVLVVPAAAWLVIGRARDEGCFRWREWAAAALIGAGILALFYVPFLLNPNFERTFAYLLQGRVGTDESGLPFSWSGAAVWQMITFYNSLWYILGLIVLVLAGLGKLWRERWGAGPALYFVVPLLFYTLVVGDPRTHVYTIFPGAVLLGALGAAWVWDSLSGRGHWAAGILFGGWIVVSTVYVALLFVEVIPERQRTWAENRPSPAVFPTTWDEPPLYGLFGFPHQAGWRAASDLIGAEGLSYASNEEEEITNYYMRQAARTHCGDFETFVLAANVQDEIPYEPEMVEGLFLKGEVRVEGETRMWIFTREAAGATAVVEAEEAEHWVTPEQVRPPLFRGAMPVGVNLADQVVLAGYDLSETATAAGGRLVVRLYWEVVAPFEANKQVFVHLFDAESQQVIAQDDGAPECAVNPTTRWEPGQIVVDPHVVEITAEAGQGSWQLLVGMYDLLTRERLERVDGRGDSIYLRDVVVR
jgi:hypothetical protein